MWKKYSKEIKKKWPEKKAKNQKSDAKWSMCFKVEEWSIDTNIAED